MPAWLTVIILFWCACGPYQIKEEIENGNEKLAEMPFGMEAIWLAIKSLIFGPFTRSKLIARM